MYYSKIAPTTDGSHYVCHQESGEKVIIDNKGNIVSCSYHNYPYNLMVEASPEIEELWKVKSRITYCFMTSGVLVTSCKVGTYAFGEDESGNPVYGDTVIGYDYKEYFFQYDTEE